MVPVPVTVANTLWSVCSVQRQQGAGCVARGVWESWVVIQGADASFTVTSAKWAVDWRQAKEEGRISPR